MSDARFSLPYFRIVLAIPAASMLKAPRSRSWPHPRFKSQWSRPATSRFRPSSASRSTNAWWNRCARPAAFQKVYRTGDRAADAIPDLVTLHTKVETFKAGSQTKRELTTVLGATKVDVIATVTSRDGQALLDKKITGRVRFFGENLGVTNDLAKRITKLVRETF